MSRRTFDDVRRDAYEYAARMLEIAAHTAWSARRPEDVVRTLRDAASVVRSLKGGAK